MRLRVTRFPPGLKAGIPSLSEDGRIAAAGFRVLVLIAVLVGTYLSPNGLPVGVEIGLLVALWTNVACQVVALAFDS